MFRIKPSTVAKLLNVQRKPQGFIGREAKGLLHSVLTGCWSLSFRTKTFKTLHVDREAVVEVLRGNGDNDSWHRWQQALCGPTVVSFGSELAYVEQRAFLKACLNLIQKKTQSSMSLLSCFRIPVFWDLICPYHFFIFKFSLCFLPSVIREPSDSQKV